MSFFPKSEIKSNGNSFVQQNKELGPFAGKITAIREIKSQSNPTVFGVIEITVPGKEGVFQDYLNYNPQKAEQSIGFLVSHAKACVLSTGAGVDMNEEKDLDWVEKAYQKIMADESTVRFIQSADKQGRVSISYQTGASVDEPAF